MKPSSAHTFPSGFFCSDCVCEIHPGSYGQKLILFALLDSVVWLNNLLKVLFYSAVGGQLCL